MLVLRVYFWVFSLPEEETIAWNHPSLLTEHRFFLVPDPIIQRPSSQWAKWELWMLRALITSEPGTVSSDLCCTRSMDSPKERVIRPPSLCTGLCRWYIAVDTSLDTSLLQQQKQFLGKDVTPKAVGSCRRPWPDLLPFHHCLIPMGLSTKCYECNCYSRLGNHVGIPVLDL